jgi:hypothetical protein
MLWVMSMPLVCELCANVAVLMTACAGRAPGMEDLPAHIRALQQPHG